MQTKYLDDNWQQKKAVPTQNATDYDTTLSEKHVVNHTMLCVDTSEENFMR